MEMKNKIKYSAADLMPNDAKACQILNERAKKLAEKSETIEKKVTVNYIRFQIGNNEYYGIPYHSVQEVIENVVLTKIPHAEQCVAGVINHRGTLLTIIDLTQFFQIPSVEFSQKIYVIVTKIKGVSIGVMANKIEDIAEYEKISNESSYQGMIRAQYILGIHDNHTTILNMDTMMTDLQLLLAGH